MAGYIEDRWLNKRKDPVTGKRERTALWGTKTKRYRVKGIPGVKDCSFGTLEDAKTWQATAFTDKKRQQFIDPRDGEMPVSEFVETLWWPARRDPVGTANTMKSKIWNHLLPHIGSLPMNSVDREALERLLATLRDKGLEESTILDVWVHGTSVFKSAIGKRVVLNPFSVNSDLRPRLAQTKARAWAAEDVHAIRAGLADWYQICVDLGVSAGLRQAEAFGFSPDDVNESKMVLHLRRQLLWDPSNAYFKLPKGSKERDVPLSPGLLKRIQAHVEKYPPKEVTLPWDGPGNSKRPAATVPLLLTTWHGNAVNNSTFNKKNLKPALAAAGLIAARDEDAEGSGWEPSREKMFHRFRHTYASVQLHAGEDVVSLSHWMGHSSPKITLDTYAHFMPDTGQRGRSAVDAWLDVESR